MFKVIRDFYDAKDNDRKYFAGDIYEGEDEKRIKQLQNHRLSNGEVVSFLEEVKEIEEEIESDNIEEVDDLEKFNKDKLMEMLDANGITYDKKATKPQLIALLEGMETEE